MLVLRIVSCDLIAHYMAISCADVPMRAWIGLRLAQGRVDAIDIVGD